MQCGRFYLPARGGSGDCHYDAALGHKCIIKSDIEALCWQVEEMLTDEEIVDHAPEMGCEENDVELIESDDYDVDMEPSKMTLVECRESLKVIANFIAKDACLGDKTITSPTTSKQVTSNASNVCYEPQANWNQFFFCGCGYLRSC